MRTVVMALSVMLMSPVLAGAVDTRPPAGASATAHELPYTHPTLPPHPAAWAGVVVIVIAGMFLAAAAIGPIVRANMPEEISDTRSHDEHGHGEHDTAHGEGHARGHH